MPESIPKQIDRFTILNELGKGGFGHVYRAFDPSVGREVAIKVLSEPGKDVQLNRFRNEAAVAGNLRHGNIVTVYQYGEHEGQPFLVMEYLEGEELHQVISSKRPLTLLEKCDIMWQVAEGLYCAHQNGVVHRDVKPGNIMVRPDGSVKIMDFGIARITRDAAATRLTQAGYIIGTLLYMAPEQFSGSDIDALCDIFAYGVIYYELLTGRHPFAAGDSGALIYKIIFEEPPPIREFVPDCPDGLQHVISRILSKDRKLRYQSLKEVQLDIDPIRTDLQRQRAAALLVEAQRLFDAKQLDEAHKVTLEVLSLDSSNRAARSLREDLQKQIQLRALRPRIELLASTGEDHLAQRRFNEAVQSFEEAVRLDPENEAVQDRMEHARNRRENHRAAAALLAVARQEFGAQNLDAAHSNVSKALQHEPDNGEAAEMLGAIQAAIERRERERRIVEAMYQAESLRSRQAYDEAIALLASLGAEAASPPIQGLLSSIRAEKEAEERRVRLRNSLAAAEDLVQGRRLEEAVASLEALQKEFSDNQEVNDLLAHARSELATARRVKAIGEIGKQAAALGESNQFDAAVALLQKALGKYPGDDTLIRLLSEAAAAKADHDRRQAIEAARRESSDLRSRQQFAEAKRVVESALRTYGGEPALIDLLERIEEEWDRQKRAEAIRDAVQQARTLLDRQRAHEALQFLKDQTVQYPGEPGLIELLNRAEQDVRAWEKAQALDAIRRRVASMVTAHDFTAALAALDEGLQKWQADPGLLQQRENVAATETEWKRQQEIQDVSQRVTELASRQQFSDATELVAAIQGKYPKEESIAQLAARIGTQWEQHKRKEAIQKIVDEVRALLSQNQLDRALEIVNEGAQKYPGEADLKALRSKVQQAIEARRRANAVEKLVKESQDLLTASQFNRAREVLKSGLASFPGDPALLRQMDLVHAGATAWEREQAVKQAIAKARQLAVEQHFKEALQLLASLPADTPELPEVRRKIEGDWEESKGAAAIAQAVATGESLLRRDRLEEAVAYLGKACAQFPGEASLLALLAKIEERIEARRPRDRAVNEAESLLEQEKPEDAIRVLEAVPAEFHGDPKVRALLARATAAAIANQSREARARVDAGDLAGALALLDEALRRWPGEAGLTALRESVLSAKALRERQEAIHSAASRCEQLAKERRLEAAVLLAKQSLLQFPNEPVLLQLQQRLQTELQEEDRRKKRQADLEELGRLEERAARATGTTPLAELLDAVRSITARYPGDDDVRSAGAATIALLTAIENARKEISSRNFSNALEICFPFLAEYPEHAIFKDLRQEAERGQRLAYVEDLRRKAGAERDLTARARLLQQGLDYYPDEEWIAVELQFTRTKLSLVDSIVQKARNFERSEAWAQALEQWNTLASIYAEYPGLNEQIKRSSAARDRAHVEAIARWVRQIEEKLGMGDLEKAGDLLQKALVEAPESAALQVLSRRLEELRQNREKARALLAQGHAACQKGNYEDGKSCLRAAFELDGHDAAFRKQVLDALIKYAKVAQQTSWQQAEALLRDVSALDPKYPVPKGLVESIAEAKQSEVVATCLRTADQMRQAGDLRAALQEVERVLATYAAEGRLIKLRSGLTAEIEARRQALATELRGMHAVAEASTNLLQIQGLLNRAQAIATEQRHDTELSAQSDQTARYLVSRIKALKRAQLVERLSSNWKWIALPGAAALVLLGVVVVSRMLPTRSETTVNIISGQDGVSVAVMGKTCVTPNCRLMLPAGSYTLTATKDGYKPVSMSVTVAAKQPALDVPITFEPLPEMLQINTNFGSGRVLLDGRAAGELRDGQLSISGIAQGDHVVRVTGEGAEFEAKWRSAPAAPPILLKPLVAKDVQAAVVANAGTSGAIVCNCGAQSVSVDGVPAAQTDASAGTPTPLNGLRLGPRSFAIDGRTLIVNVGPNPALNISLALNREIGTLVIETGQDSARVYLNNRLHRETTRRGMVRIPLPVGAYTVRVEKDGFKSPGAQTVDVKKGEDRQVAFSLVPAPATLEIAGAIPGALVKVDGHEIGTVGRDGRIRQEVSSGDHQIELTKDDYSPVRFPAHFTPGSTTKPAPAQIAMSPITKPPVQPDARQLEAEDWQRIANSTNPEDLDDFVRKHPGSARVAEARSRAAQLRQQSQLAAARQAEQTAWDGTDKNSKAALQDFLSRHQGGTHAQDARRRIAELDKKDADADLAAKQRAAEAEKKLTDDKRAEDETAVSQALAAFQAAYHQHDLNKLGEIWRDSSSLAKTRQEFGYARISEMSLQPAGRPVVTGSTATITCTRVHTFKPKDGGREEVISDRVRVTLDRAGANWVIRSIAVF